MSEYQVEVSALAKEEIISISLYLRNTLKNNLAANDFLTETYNKIQDLNFMPGRYPILSDSKKNIRKMSYINFILIFEIKESKVIVLRVFHSSKNY